MTLHLVHRNLVQGVMFYCTLYEIIIRNKQEAQLPLRNRASVMHFFVAKLLSIAIMSYSYVCHP